MNREDQLKEALRRAQAVIKDLQGRADQRREPIAVIGLGCRFPAGGRDAVGLEAFHDFLMQGRDSVRPIGPERAGWRLPPGSGNDPTLNRAAFLERDFCAADYDFFRLNPAEARLMDPQFHLMLETAWQAVENAGLAPADLAGSDTAVFVGRSGTEFTFDLVARDQGKDDDPYTLTGNMGSSLSGRIAYFFDWYGPAVSVETACSTGLVAVIQAMESLWSGRSALALAGAVNLLVGPSPSLWLKAMGALSPSGVCRPFGAGADGFVRGEGAAALLLKPLSAAERDGDRIIALLAGGAVGSDGHSAGFTVGSVKAQRRVMTRALAEAGLNPLEVAYVETHGTGTSVGDPIEAESLLAVYGRERPATAPLLIGSVKSNLGHLEAAAGLAGLVKAIGAVKFGQLAPSLHAGELTPLIDWADSPLELNRSVRSWPAGYARKAAGVSAFAISGTLAHLIVTEAPAEKSPEQPLAEPGADRSLIMSAFDEETLRQTAADCLDSLAAGVDFGAMAEAAQRRVTGPERLVVTAADGPEAASVIQSVLEGRVKRNAARGRVEPDNGGVLFMFSGQGSQAPGMGRELYGLYPVFRQILDRCEDAAAPRLGHSLLEVMFSPGDTRLNQTQVTQAAIFAHQAALTALLEAHGCRPAAVMGHSIGEYAAAVTAGVFSLETGLDLVLTRGRLAQELEAEGAMAAVLASEEAAGEVLGKFPGLGIIAVNGPGTVTVAGEKNQLAAALDEMRRHGLDSRPLPVSQAFHCPLVEPLLEPWGNHLRAKGFSAAQRPFLSTLTGDYLDRPDQDWPAYFVEQTRRPVKFYQALLAARQSVALEIGSGPTLTSYARQIRDDFTWLFAQSPGRDHRQYLTALAGLFSRGRSTGVGNPPRNGPRRPEAMPPTRFRPKPLDIPGLADTPPETAAPKVEERLDSVLAEPPEHHHCCGGARPLRGLDQPPTQPVQGPAGRSATIALAKEQCERFKQLCIMQIKQLRPEKISPGMGDGDQ